MKLIVFALLLALLPQVLRAEDLRDTEGFWSLQLKKVQRGMRQSQVTELLPQRSEGKMDYAEDGRSYTFTYALDEHWSVATVFDRSSFRRKNNPYTVMGYPNDKVIRLPRLQRQENLIDEALFPSQPPRACSEL